MRKWLPLLVLNFCILAAVSWLAAGATPAQQSATPTPPPPTWTPGPAPTKTPQGASLPDAGPGGGAIELQVRFGPAALKYGPEAWTVVQWQDAWGDWHDVEGWRGTLDEVVSAEGRKIWWVYRRDLGKGPFRWLVHDRAGGKLLVASQLFNLPGVSGQTVKVQVELEP